MRKQFKTGILLLVVALLLTGCSLRTVDELYCLPKRSEDYDNLQSVIDQAMRGFSYSAPINGEYRQTVQMADLDGDGNDEYLLFAKDDSDNPLKILIFCQLASGYVLMDTIEGYGFAFDFVDYAQIDDRPGLEIVVGRQVSNELVRSVSVYRFTSGFSRQLMSTSYTKYALSDLDADEKSELLLLCPGESENGKGIAALYEFDDGEMHRAAVVSMSESAGRIMRVTTGVLQDGLSAVYVTSSQNNQTLVTDVFALADEELTNISGGSQIQTLHNYNVFPEDVDGDGVVELPSLVPIQTHAPDEKERYCIRWYSLYSLGSQREKTYTFHNFADGWYLDLENQWISGLSVEQTEDAYIFYLREQTAQPQQILSIYTLTGSDREEQAERPGRILLYKGDSIIFAAELSEYAKSLGILEEDVIAHFHPIRMEWHSEEK